MHRTISVPRPFVWAILLTGLLLPVGIRAVSAQELLPISFQEEKKAKGLVLDLTLKQRHIYQMTTKEALKKVENSDSKVLMVKSLADDKRFSEVLFEAVGVGTSIVTLTDVKGNVESVEVTVIDEESARKLEALIRRVVPSSVVTVARVGQTGVVLNGYVLTVEDGRVVQQMAEKMFPAANIVVQGGAQTAGQVQPQTNVINNIRIGGVQQVQLEVIVAVVNRSELRNMSFSWVNNGTNFFLGSVLPAGGNFANTIAAGTTAGSMGAASSATLPFGIINSKNAFSAYLNALRTEGLAKILAEPRVTTLSGRPGSFTSGGEVPVILPGTAGSGPSVTYKPFGTVVNFLPVVLGNGRIHLEVRPEISEKDDSLSVTLQGAGGGGSTVAPGFKTRTAQVAVQIEDGQTLAIGGLIQNKVGAIVTRIPILGDLPFVGFCFTDKSYRVDEEEMIILVTPRLVDPVDCTKIPKYLPGRETRVPDDFELFLEGIIEAPRGPRRVFDSHHYIASHRNAPNNGIPCGFDGHHGGNGCANGNCGVPSFPIGLPQSMSMPPASGRVNIEPQPIPTGRDFAPNLGPAVPTAPNYPTNGPGRQLDNRPVLPPVTFGPGRPE